MRSHPSPRYDDHGSSVVEFTLVTPLVLLLVLALLQLAITMHTRSVIESAAEDAVRVAASYGGNSAAGEQRFRDLTSREVRSDAIQSLTWASTLDTLTLRVRSRLPLLGPLGDFTMTTDASAYHEEWP